MAATLAGMNPNDDPLDLLIAPPAGESLMERDFRLRKEAEAKHISDIIDEQIKQDAMRRKKDVEVRLLLLGQSASGKSTLQKQFRLMYAKATLDAERLSWRSVVYINLVKSVRIILEALEYEYDLDFDTLSPGGGSPVASSSPRPFMRDDNENENNSTDDLSYRIPSSLKGKGRAIAEENPSDLTPSGFISTSPRSPKASAGTVPPGWANQLITLRLRLTPILSMEEILARKIGTEVKVAPGKEDFFVRSGWQGLRRPRATSNKLSLTGQGSLTEPTLNEASKHRSSMDSTASFDASTTAEWAFEQDQKEAVVRQVASLLAASQEDIQALWQHPALKSILKKRRLRLEESSTFFLSELSRIAVHDYIPTDDDMLRARLRTMGVVEHRFEVSNEVTGKTYEWRLYDVGGSRGQRPKWIPYFEEANAIIFLAPISAFDQYLEEDGRTNRVDDSLQLFTLICSNPLLKNVHLVLFLNKTDVLKKKLEAGVKVKKYITSYGDRPNDYAHVSQYFNAHFKQVHRKNNIELRRELYTHLTSMVDTKATRQIIVSVQDAIFRDNLKDSSMM
ncbi:hypothetical protein FRB96_004839 [Tulasnella sp. 330]|nr:hypothetical protein FRB96_004839 [Tulasnella sp. 330]KAG8874516.1 hypothetical protein FRB97_005858 [Tulasnella sp. 331]KAG8879320.1 hypothetical protein FRB98_005716 [Tulasnella sp. 332]